MQLRSKKGKAFTGNIGIKVDGELSFDKGC